MNPAPPPSSVAEIQKTKGKPFALTSAIIAAVGILPLLVYLLVSIGHADSYYRTGGNPFLVLGMGFIGFVIHGIGLASGITGLCLGSKKLSLAALIANAIIFAGVLICGFLAIALS